ncbi:MAG: hypothetical protein HYY30_07135 [Chloroflexi bacterium]|nr:hypothetical protein [Chloroflexota bacterium]
MILRQKSTSLDPFLLKFVCHHFDSKPLRWMLRLFGLWIQKAQVDDSTKREPLARALFAIHLDRNIRLVNPIPISKIEHVKGFKRNGR